MAIFRNMKMRVNAIPCKVRWKQNSTVGEIDTDEIETDAHVKNNNDTDQEAAASGFGKSPLESVKREGGGPAAVHESTESSCQEDEDRLSSSLSSDIQEENLSGEDYGLKRMVSKPVLTVDIPSCSDSGEKCFIGTTKLYRDMESAMRPGGAAPTCPQVPQTTRSSSSFLPAIDPSNLTSPQGDTSSSRGEGYEGGQRPADSHYYVALKPPEHQLSPQKPDLVAMDICDPPLNLPTRQGPLGRRNHFMRSQTTKYQGYDMDVDPAIAEQWERWNYSALLEACSKGEYAEDDMEYGGEGSREWLVCHPNYKPSTMETRNTCNADPLMSTSTATTAAAACEAMLRRQEVKRNIEVTAINNGSRIGTENRKTMFANMWAGDDRLVDSSSQHHQYVGNVPESWRGQVPVTCDERSDNMMKMRSIHSGYIACNSEVPSVPNSNNCKDNGIMMVPDAIGGDSVQLNSHVHSITTRRRLQGLATAALRRHSTDIIGTGGAPIGSSSTSSSIGHSLGINYPYLRYFV